MVESHKETPSTAAPQKKNSSLDDDFAEDFLTSWKSSKVGKDSIDFEVDTVPRSGKKSFYFGKLDDFELAADFDKLSSFKMDLSNLDFPSPCKKAEKPKNKSSKDSGGQEEKQDKFSFTFDFNEFSLDSNLLEKKKTSNFKDGNRLDCSGKQHVDQDFRSNSATINDSIECKTTKSALIEDSMTTSLPEHSVDCGNTKGPGSSISLDPGHQNTTNEARISSEIRTAMSEGNNSEPHSIESQQKQLDGRCCTKKYSENADHTFLLRPVSGDTSETKAVPESDVKLANSDHLLMEAIMEQDNSMKPIYSSQSRNSSPENSSNSQCFPKMSRTKSVNASGKLENQRRNMDEASDGSTLDDEVKGQKDGNASETNATLKSLEETKSTGEKQNASTKLLCSPLNALIRTRIMKENSSAALQLKSLNKAAGNVYCATSAFISKQLHSMGNKNIGTSHSRPLNEERASTRNDEQAENQRRGILKPFDKAGMKNVPVISGRESNSKVCDTSGFQIHPSSMPNQAGVSSMLTEKSPRLVLSISPMTSSITISSETKDICPKDDKQFDISSLANSRLARLNLNSSKSMMQKDTKTVKFCQEKMLSPLSTVPKVATSVITERNALSSPSLKRKVLEQNLLAYISAISSFYDMQVQILHDVGHTRATWARNMIATFQESKEDPVISNPSKRLRESLAERRNSLEASRQVDKQLIEVSGSPAPPRKEIVVDNQNSPIHPPSMGSMVDFEVPISVEDDGNVTKAEACAKELDDICNMLRKKHDEAKDLLVRAVVNNNTLLMLNHPMFDEKFLSQLKHPRYSKFRQELAVQGALKAVLSVRFHAVPQEQLHV